MSNEQTLLNNIAEQAAHEIMAQVEFGAPTEKLFELIVENACLEYSLLSFAKRKEELEESD